MSTPHSKGAAPIPAFPPVRFVTGGAFELVAELSAFTSGTARGSLDSGKLWIREVRALAGAELVGRVERFGINVYAELATIALEAAEPRGVAELLAAIRALGAEAFRRRLFGADSTMTRSMVAEGAIELALASEAGAVAELRSTFGFDRARRVAIDRLIATPAGVLLEEFS